MLGQAVSGAVWQTQSAFNAEIGVGEGKVRKAGRHDASIIAAIIWSNRVCPSPITSITFSSAATSATMGAKVATTRAPRVCAITPSNARINMAGCLDRCASGPVMVVYPEGVWYTYQNEKDVDEILDEHVAHGRIVERLRLKP
jgi:(2Fe-2S) ferredoxin